MAISGVVRARRVRRAMHGRLGPGLTVAFGRVGKDAARKVGVVEVVALLAAEGHARGDQLFLPDAQHSALDASNGPCGGSSA